MGLTFFGSRILTRVAGFGRAGAATRGLTVFVGDGLATGGSKPAIQLVEIIRTEGRNRRTFFNFSCFTFSHASNGAFFSC